MEMSLLEEQIKRLNLRRCPNTKPALCQRFVFVELSQKKVDHYLAFVAVDTFFSIIKICQCDID